MDKITITNEAKTSYYDSLIRSVENEILTAKNKLSKLQIRLNDLKKQRNFHSGSIQKRITELFIRGR
jgi:predicted  nucleic acid-binding Zn-ribbon protein